MLFPMTNILYIYISTLWSICTMPRMAVFCSPLISSFPDKSLRYLMNDVEMVPVAPVITVITYVFTFYIQCISTAMSLCIVTSFQFLSWSHFYVLKLQCILTDMFLICCHTLWCPVYCEGWLSVFACWSTLISWLVSTNFGTYSYQCSLTNLTPVPCTCQYTLAPSSSSSYSSTLCVVLFLLLAAGLLTQHTQKQGLNWSDLFLWGSSDYRWIRNLSGQTEYADCIREHCTKRNLKQLTHTLHTSLPTVRKYNAMLTNEITYAHTNTHTHTHTHTHTYKQGVPGGMCQTSGECSLC